MLSVCLHSLCNFYLFYEILDFAFLKLCKRDLITIREETLSLIFDFFFFFLSCLQNARAKNIMSIWPNTCSNCNLKKKQCKWIHNLTLQNFISWVLPMHVNNSKKNNKLQRNENNQKQTGKKTTKNNNNNKPALTPTIIPSSTHKKTQKPLLK